MKIVLKGKCSRDEYFSINSVANLKFIICDHDMLITKNTLAI